MEDVAVIKNLGYKLKTLRVNNQLSRKQVADLVGVSVSTIGLYESDERLPSLPVLVKLATQYKTSVDYLLGVESVGKDMLSLDGLTDKQIKALKMTAECFRNQN